MAGWTFGRVGRLLLPIVLLALAVAFQRYFESGRSAPPVHEVAERGDHGGTSGDGAIAEAFQKQRSGVWVESSGIVERLLGDDREGTPHQRMLLRLDNGQTLLVAHNIKLAPRVPVRRGDRIRFRGQYEWNERGGVIHWTHNDPQANPAAGWIECGGRTYR